MASCAVSRRLSVGPDIASSPEAAGARSAAVTMAPLGRNRSVAGGVTAVVSGACTINGSETDLVTFDLSAAVAPTNTGGGVTQPISQATLQGAFAASPVS